MIFKFLKFGLGFSTPLNRPELIIYRASMLDWILSGQGWTTHESPGTCQQLVWLNAHGYPRATIPPLATVAY